MTCCPDGYYCPASGDFECPRHSDFQICCDRPGEHKPHGRDAWNAEQARLEREWLDSHIRDHIRQQRQLLSLVLVHPAA